LVLLQFKFEQSDINLNREEEVVLTLLKLIGLQELK